MLNQMLTPPTGPHPSDRRVRPTQRKTPIQQEQTERTEKESSPLHLSPDTQEDVVIPVLVLLALLSGCALVDRAADLTGPAFAGVAGRKTTPVGDPLSLHLQLALLSDRVVTHIVQATEAPLDAVDDPNRRAALLRIRLDYASAMWNAASGPNPYANAIDMLLTLTVGRRRLERSSLAHALGESLRPILAVLRSAESDVERLVRGFLTPAELSALDQAIREAEESSDRGATAGHRRPVGAPVVVASSE